MTHSMSMLATIATCLFFAGSIATTFPDCVNGPSELTTNLVCDQTASPADRAAAIIDEWTIEEKLSNLNDTGPGVSRLGLPPYEWWSEALHGYADARGSNFSDSGDFSSATSFPQPMIMSAAFDDQLIHDIAVIIGTESRAFGNTNHAGLDFWTPNINPFKDPRWGRGAETPGEDITRIKGYTKALIRGLEGDDKNFRRVVATCKHFAGYDLEAWGGVTRYSFDAQISTQDLAEYYTPPFQTCARDENVGSFMCSYNAINGVPACADPFLMQTLLREHWGWTEDHQYITTDCGAISGNLKYHGYGETVANNTALAFNAGVDTVCDGGSDPFAAYDEGLLSEDVVTRSLERQYEALVRAGYFDTESTDPYRSLDWSDVNTQEAQDLAVQAAQQGMTLLKNQGDLPLDLPADTSVALIGFWTNDTGLMLGGYSGIPPYLHGPRYAARALDLQINFAGGPLNETADSEDDDWTADAIAAAEKSDIIFYFGGIDVYVERERVDRYSIAWPGAQQQLIETICDGTKPCIVVQMGSMLDQTPLLENDNVNAILWAGYPGQSGGTAAFDLITGKVSPSGRLPLTMYPANYTDEIPMTEMSLRPSDSSPGRTYRWYSTPVLPFGFGLQCTTFSSTFDESDYGDVDIGTLTDECTETHKDLCTLPLDLPYTVENTGDTTSSFSALAFVTGEYGPEPYPIKTLVDYQRFANIQAGESRSSSFSFILGNLARYTSDGDQVLYPGTYELLLDVPTQSRAKFTLTGSPLVLDEWPRANSTMRSG